MGFYHTPSQFYRQGNSGPERFSNLLKATRPSYGSRVPDSVTASFSEMNTIPYTSCTPIKSKGNTSLSQMLTQASGRRQPHRLKHLLCGQGSRGWTLGRCQELHVLGSVPDSGQVWRPSHPVTSCITTTNLKPIEGTISG